MNTEYKNISQSQEKIANPRNLFHWNSNFDNYLDSPRKAFSGLTKSDLALLDLLFWTAFTFDKIYPTEGWLAVKVGVNERTIRRTLEKAAPLGLVNPQQRYNTSCVFRLNSKLFKLQILEELRFIFPTVNSYLYRVEQQNVRLCSLLSNFNIDKTDKTKTKYIDTRVSGGAGESPSVCLFLEKENILSRTKKGQRPSDPITLIQKGKEMNESVSLLLKSLGLSEENIKELAVFPDDIIVHIVSSGRKNPTGVGNWKAYLLSGCNRWLQERGGRPSSRPLPINLLGAAAPTFDFGDNYEYGEPRIDGDKYSNDRVREHTVHPNCTCKLIWSYNKEGKPIVIAVPKNSNDERINPRSDAEQQPGDETNQIHASLKYEMERIKRDLADGAYTTRESEAMAKHRLQQIPEQMKLKSWDQLKNTGQLENPYDLQEKYKVWLELPETVYVKEKNPQIYENLHNVILRSIEVARRKWNEAHPKNDKQTILFIKD